MISAPKSVDVLLRVRGIVQGVGFRPFVHRLATELGLRGWVRNDAQGVLIRVVGGEEEVDTLLRRLRERAPPAARVRSVATETAGAQDPEAGGGFHIIASERTDQAIEAAIPPDLALCRECRAELLEPTDRRHRYPFINCTQCGPRYSILESLPYDRPRTTMRAFRMCPTCQREYDDVADRRFHAQPNACPQCGPAVRLTEASGQPRAHAGEALAQAAAVIRAGGIVAVKGIGGYHLVVDATNDRAVAQLRQRKHRDEKPFAVMFADLAAVRGLAEVSEDAAERLQSPAAPIVLLPRRAESALAPGVAPGNPWVGAMVAYSPLHVLLLAALAAPIVATSGNLADEPLCTDPDEARRRLAGIADVFLEHNRPIAHPVDDSVVRLSSAGPILLRRARGYAPAPLALPGSLSGHWLCVGAQMKSVIGVAAGDQVVLSPHLGDLGGAATVGVFQRTVTMLAALHERRFTAVACDKHPDYASTRHARQTGLPCLEVQHHLAHVLACLLEHRREPDGVLGVALDGTGYGEDGTIWGGEFIVLEQGRAHRFGRLRPFRLAGGEAAIRNAHRVALGLLHETRDDRFIPLARSFGLSPDDAAVLRIMLARGINSPLTSSVGRMFDAVGALLAIGGTNHFEGQTALAVEAAATAASHEEPLDLPLRRVAGGEGARCEIDWAPLVEQILQRRADVPAGSLAAGFHAALANAMVAVAREAGLGTVALSGGCFQNALLLARTVRGLRGAGFHVLTHRDLPPNDGNIAAGQAAAACWGLSSVILP